MKRITNNKKAFFDYEFSEKIEAGIVLTGDEVKSLPAGHANLTGAFATIHQGQLTLLNCPISSYSHAYQKGEQLSRRTRVLLVHKKKIIKLVGEISRKGVTLIPLKLYFNDKGNMYILQGAVSLEALIKAQKQLESALDSAESDLEITVTIKCFEYCYELSWKTMRKILEFYGIEDINSPRKVFAAAFLNNLITDLDLWNSFIEKRNLTTHTYNSTLAHTIFESLDIFYKALIDFMVTIEKL